MTLKMASAPHLRLTERSAALSLDVLIALVPLCVFSFVHYGVRPVLLVLTGIVTAVVCDLLCCAFMRRKPSVLDGTAAVTGAGLARSSRLFKAGKERSPDTHRRSQV